MASFPPLAERQELGSAAFVPTLPLPRWAVLWRARTKDVGIALLLLVAGILSYLAHIEVEITDVGVDAAEHDSPIAPVLLIIGQTIPLIWRRYAPAIVLAGVTFALVLFLAFNFVPSLASLGLLVALYAVATHRPWSVSIPATITCGVVLLGLIAISPQPFELEAIVGTVMFLGAAWVLGDGVRERRSHVLLLEHRATSLELEREQRAREAVAQERRIIARDLHDVVAHNVSVMVAQATAAQETNGVGDATPVLGTIEGLGRETLAEMRRLTGLLRSDDGRLGWTQPGLDDIPNLVEQVRAAGVPTTLEIAGVPRAVPPGLGLSAYRIVQEALTNVLKHAGHVRTRVVIGYRDASLDLLVENDDGEHVRDDARSDHGYGHVGMRERVTLYNGDVAIGERRGGGYAVAVSLPLDGGPER